MAALVLAPNSGFDYGNGYFDNDNCQTLFLDGILMDIQIWPPDGATCIALIPNLATRWCNLHLYQI